MQENPIQDEPAAAIPEPEVQPVETLAKEPELPPLSERLRDAQGEFEAAFRRLDEAKEMRTNALSRLEGAQRNAEDAKAAVSKAASDSVYAVDRLAALANEWRNSAL